VRRDVEGIEQPDRIDAGRVCEAGAHPADQPAELGQHRVELVLEQRRRGRGAAERAVAAIERDDLVPILRKPMREAQAVASSPRRARESAGAGGRVGYAATPAADRLPESSYTSRNGAVVDLTAAVSRSNLRAMPLSAGFRHQTTRASPRHGTGGM
jgi:hypothetical protein